MIRNVAKIFHENTKMHKHSFNEIRKRIYDTAHHPIYQEYLKPNKKYSVFPMIKLPAVTNTPKNKDIIHLLKYRRSIREYKRKKIKLKYLSLLLKLSASATKESLGEDNITKFYLRTFPSAGALNPINLYILNLSVSDLEKYGIYYYDPMNHELVFLNKIDRSDVSISETLIYQEFVLNTGFIILLSGDLKKIDQKYGSRGYRYLLLEAGHIMQNIYLIATALDLGSCAIGGFLDDIVNSWILVDGIDEVSLYLACVGLPKKEEVK